jgi:hypothetical protein
MLSREGCKWTFSFLKYQKYYKSKTAKTMLYYSFHILIVGAGEMIIRLYICFLYFLIVWSERVLDLEPLSLNFLLLYDLFLISVLMFIFLFTMFIIL